MSAEPAPIPLHFPSPSAAKARLRKAHPSCVTLVGYFLIASQESRDQARNKELCLEKLADYIRTALVPPKPRHATKPTRASKERRIEAKKTRATVKSVRSKKIRHDE